jgi:exonuclease SbcC
VIKSILSIKLEGFRSYSGTRDVPLDSEIVLLHGPNGSGKTSFLSGLEAAISGKVQDLAKFESDYPRSLVHVGSQSANVSVTYVNEQGQTCESSLSIQNGNVELSSPFSTEERNSYTNRCYLSQAKLSRILDIYETFDEDGMGGVGFLREIFGSDTLENVIEGLTIFKNVRSVAPKSSKYAALAPETGTILNEIGKQKRQLDLLKLDALELFSKCQGLWKSVFNDQLAIEFNRDSIEECLQTTQTPTPEQNPSTLLVRFEFLQTQLTSAVNLISLSGGKRELENLERLGTTVKTFQARRELEEGPIAILLDTIEGTLDQLQVYPYRSDKPIEPHLRAQAIEAAFLQEKIRINDDLIERDESEKLRQVLLEKKNQNLAIVNDNSATEVETQKATDLPVALTALLEHVVTDECPVCARDFSETQKGSLRDFFRSRVEGLGISSQAAENKQVAITKAKSELHTLENQIIAIEAKQKAKTKSYEILSTAQRQIDNFLENLRANHDALSNLADIYQQIQSCQDAYILSQTRIQQYKSSVEKILEIAGEIGATITDQASAEFWAPCAVKLQNVIDDFRIRVAARERLIKALQETLDKMQSLDSVQKLISRNETRRVALERSSAHTQEFVESMRTIRQLALEAQEEIYKTVFSDRLNRLYSDLFMRLVNQEKFLPFIKPPTKHRGRLSTGIMALFQGHEFNNARSVLSAGNISTAALSLFLTLNLMERTTHGVLVLDDPIQSIDDIKVSQLARVIRTIAEQTKRQVFLAVHERSLFEGLRIELSPRNSQQTLLVVELENRGQGTDVKTEKINWQGDDVSFSAEK